MNFKNRTKYLLYSLLVIILIGPLGYLADSFIPKDPERVYMRQQSLYYLLVREASWNGCFSSEFNAYLKDIPDINWQDEDGNTFLHNIVGGGFRAKQTGLCINRLARDFTLKVSLKNKLGQTPIALAIKHYNVSAFKELIRLGASLKELNPNTRALYNERILFRR